MKQSVLRIQHLSKSYGKRMVIRDISMERARANRSACWGQTVPEKQRHFIA